MRLSVHDVAKLCKVTDKIVYRWVEEGGLPAHRIDEQYRFNRAEVLEWAMAQKINLAGDLFAEPENGRTALPCLAEAIKTGGVHYRVSGSDKGTVLKNVVDLLQLPEDTDRQFLLHVLLARESMGSTGIGEGIAIPHVRNPIVLAVPVASISVCFLEKPIDFGAVDGKPVHTLFTLISPTVRGHLHVLSRLMHVLRDEAMKECLRRQGSAEELLKHVKRIEAGLPVKQGG